MPRSSLTRLIAPALVALAMAVDSSASVFAFAPSVAGDSAPTQNAVAPRTSRAIATTRSSIARSVASEWAAASKQRATAVKVKPAIKHAKKVTKVPTTRVVTRSHRGRNHVWIPSLGISRSVAWFSCSARGVANYVYRWGCAGRNNVYLFGHAFSVFKPLHDAYVRHRLYRGLNVVYADAAGRVRSYRVRFWKVVSPTNGAWAYAAQSRPSLTLQTCVGAKSQYRLIVRLVAA